MNKIWGCGLALAILLAPAVAAAQNAAMTDLQEGYAEAWTEGDVDAVLAMFVEDAVYWPASGGRYDGRDEIRGALEQEPTPDSASIVATHTETIGDDMLGVGIWSVAFSEEEGDEVGGEFVLVAEDSPNGLRIKRLIAFLPRQMSSGE